MVKELEEKAIATSKSIIVSVESLQSASHNCRINQVVEFRTVIPKHQILFHKNQEIVYCRLNLHFPEAFKIALMVIC